MSAQLDLTKHGPRSVARLLELAEANPTASVPFAKALMHRAAALDMIDTPAYRRFQDAYVHAHLVAKHRPGGRDHGQKKHGRKGGAGPASPEHAAAHKEFRASQTATDEPASPDAPAAEAPTSPTAPAPEPTASTTGEITDPGLARRMALDNAFTPNDPRNGDPDLAERIADRQRITAEYTAQGMDTHSLHDGEKHGWQYSTERAAMHKALVDTYIAGMEQRGVAFNAEAVLLGGLAGAGKSYILSQAADLGVDIGVDLDRYAVINADQVKGWLSTGEITFPDGSKAPIPGWEHTGLPGYEGLKLGTEGGEMASLLHEESSDVSALMSKQASARGMNVAWDWTMSSPDSIQKRLAELRDYHGPDYTTKALFVDVPVPVSLRSAIERYQNFPRDASGNRAGDDTYDGRMVFFDSLAQRGGDPTGQYMSSNRASFERTKHLFDEHWTFANTRTEAPRLIDSGRMSEPTRHLLSSAASSVAMLATSLLKAEDGDDPFAELVGDAEPTEPDEPEPTVALGGGILTQHFDAYARGELSYDNLRRFVVAFDYKTPVYNPPDDPFERSQWAEDRLFGPPQTDTVEELIEAGYKGLLSKNEYDELYAAVDARLSAARTTPPAAPAPPPAPPAAADEPLRDERFEEFRSTDRPQ